jgi:hypothetical protein
MVTIPHLPTRFTALGLISAIAIGTSVAGAHAEATTTQVTTWRATTSAI